MSLFSWVVARNAFGVWFFRLPFGRPGGDLLSHVLGRSTIGAEGFHGRVRDGIGCMAPRHDHQVVGTEDQMSGIRYQAAENKPVARSDKPRMKILFSSLFPDPGPLVFAWPGGHGEGQDTRSHPELGRENPQRRWYCGLSRGRVGRRQA